MSDPAQPWLIVGQGLAGSCLAWEFFRRDIPFEIVDKGSGGSSRIAAGMINPITGKNFQPSWRINEFHSPAVSFYKALERKTGASFWHPLPVVRLASSEKEWDKIIGKLEQPAVAEWLSGETIAPPRGFSGAVTLKGGGRLDTSAFMDATQRFFTNSGVHSISKHDITARHPKRILCEGAIGLLDGQLGPHRCAKGEILTLKADWDESHIRVGAGGWLVPIGNGLFRAGSTYEWHELDEIPTEHGGMRIIEIVEKLGGKSYEITEHVAGIRPILRRSEPLIGKNAKGDWIFNALGSKGSLYAPGMARMLVDWIYEGKQPEEAFVFQSCSIEPR